MTIDEIATCIKQKPYFRNESGVLYCADCLDILPQMPDKCVDLVLTDFPYGVEGGHGGQLKDYRKADYAGKWEDTPGYIKTVCSPVAVESLRIANTVAFTPGTRCLCSYPQPDEVGCFFSPASSRIGLFGFQSCHPIFYYGHYKNRGKGALCTGISISEAAEKNGHPCPKPIKAWMWLLERCSEKNDIVCDPMLGSGTTAVAAQKLGRQWIGVEISEEYCEIAAKRIEAEGKGITVKELKAGQKTLFEAAK